jgi:hypothetical protein
MFESQDIRNQELRQQMGVDFPNFHWDLKKTLTLSRDGGISMSMMIRGRFLPLIKP